MSGAAGRPDSRPLILQQLDGQWHKLAMMLLFKLSRDRPVIMTSADWRALETFIADGEKQLMTWGHRDSIELRIMKREDAERLAAHVEGMGGSRVRQ